MTLVKKLVRLHGLLSREPCMAFTLLLSPKPLERNTPSEKSIHWQKRLGGEQSWQGLNFVHIFKLFHNFILPIHDFSFSLIIIIVVVIVNVIFLTMQVERASHSERKSGIVCQAKGFGHWCYEWPLHCLIKTLWLMWSIIILPCYTPLYFFLVLWLFQ